MAKKSISDIVLRAVVDTSGVAAGLNNIGSQVAGRQYGQTAGGPIGASGAAGGFVNPHGGGAGAGAAAVAAAAVAGAAAGRRRMAGGRATSATVAGIFGKDEADRMAERAASMAGLRSARRAMEELYPGVSWKDREFKNGKFKENFYWQERFDLARQQGLRRRERINALLPGVAQGIRNRSMLGRVAGLSTKAGQMMGMGRFAPLGGAAMVSGGIGYAGVRLGQLGNEGMPSRFSDISRFEFGADREAAGQLKRYWNPANKKAPLGFVDRFFVEGRKANNGEATWLEKGVKFARSVSAK